MVFGGSLGSNLIRSTDSGSMPSAGMQPRLKHSRPGRAWCVVNVMGVKYMRSLLRTCPLTGGLSMLVANNEDENQVWRVSLPAATGSTKNQKVEPLLAGMTKTKSDTRFNYQLRTYSELGTLILTTTCLETALDVAGGFIKMGSRFIFRTCTQLRNK